MSFIEIRDLEKNIKGKNILSNINLNFEKGKIYGIKGHNGCGKTMLLRAICGLITPDSGSVAIDGKYIKKDIDFPESMGVLIENPEFWKNMTGHQVLKTLAGIKNEIGDNEIDDALKRVGLYGVQDNVGKYSLGMRQRLAIAQAVMEKPDVILLDEPTNALDRDGINRFITIIHEERMRGAVVIVVSHSMEYLGVICDKIITMENGRISAMEDVIHE